MGEKYEVKRYDVSIAGKEFETPFGQYVKYKDYEKIQKEKEEMIQGHLQAAWKIEQLEKQIINMKNCRICKYNFPGTGEDFDEYCERCENYSEWAWNE